VVGQTFEELCRAHIRAFAKGAEDFSISTKLTERVNMWQAKLAPILQDEERRAVFDIHRYSQDLLETAKQGLQRIKRKSDGSEFVRVSMNIQLLMCLIVYSHLLITLRVIVGLDYCGLRRRDEELHAERRLPVLLDVAEPR